MRKCAYLNFTRHTYELLHMSHGATATCKQGERL